MPATLDAAQLSDLESSVLGFVVRKHGQWDDQTLDKFFHFAARKHGAQDKTYLRALIERFRDVVLGGEARLYVCTGNACTHNRRFDASEEALDSASRRHGLPVVAVKCYGSCKQAPIATLGAGGECQTFSQFHNPQDWESLLQYAGRAQKAGACLADAGTAEIFRYDFRNEDEKPSVALQPLAFLIGQYRGEGTYGSYPTRVSKEMDAQWEAGGRFITMRWTATYHNPGETNYVQRVFAWGHDGGGYEETMELDYGKGFQVSTRVRMRKASACPK